MFAIVWALCSSVLYAAAFVLVLFCVPAAIHLVAYFCTSAAAAAAAVVVAVCIPAATQLPILGSL